MSSSPDSFAFSSLHSQKWQARAAETTRGWSLDALRGRLCELTGELSGERTSAALTFAFRLVLEAQQSGDLAGWVTGTEASFFPPDVARSGIDLDGLLVVRVPRALDATIAADQLARTGAFALIVIDLASFHATQERLPVALLARLSGLAQKHATVVVFVTDRASGTPSLGSLVSVRAETMRRTHEGEGFLCVLRIVRDKRNAPGWICEEVCDGPAGLC